MKQLFLLALVGLIWGLLPAQPAAPVAAQDDPTPQAAVVCRDVTLRSEREIIQSTVITLIEAGTPVEVLQYRQFWINAEWSYVRVGDMEGWVVSSHLTDLPRTTTVRVDTLNVRQLPYDQAPIVTTFAAGDVIEIVGREDDFTNGLWGYARRLSDGAEGWVSSEVVANMHRLVCQAPVLYVRPTPRHVMFWPSDGDRQLFVWTQNLGDVVAFVNGGDTLTIVDDILLYGFLGEQDFVGWQVRVDATGVEGFVSYTGLLYDLPCVASTSQSAVVYDRPALDAASIATLDNATAVTVTGADNQLNNGGAWMQIAGPVNGWVQDQDLHRCAIRRNG